MAKIYAAPSEVPLPVVDYGHYDHAVETEKEQKYLQRLKEWLRSRYTGELVGEEIRTPRGDGYARYMVMSHKPFALVHLPLGDAWRGDPIWERGINLKDARQMIERAVKRQALFAKRS